MSVMIVAACGIFLPLAASRRRGGAGHEDGEFLDVEDQELGLAQERFIEGEAQDGSGATGGDHDALAFHETRAQAFDGLGRNQLRHLARDGERLQALPLLRIRADAEADDQDASDEEERVVLLMGERQFHGDEDDEGEAEEHAFPSGKTERAIEGAGAEIERNRPYHADGVEARERIEIRSADEDDGRQDNGDGERDQRHAMAVELRELPGHFAIAGHHVEDADHGDHRGIGRADEQKEKEDADGPAERVAKDRRNGKLAEILGDEAQHVVVVLP